jgi:sulfopropanediol 3-dehydrogenase
VIADDTADPRLVAADVLGQAEHGPTSAAGAVASPELRRACEAVA